MRNSYPSKLLLFGEYLVLNHGSALSIPYPNYSLFVNSKEKKNLLDEIVEQLFNYAQQKEEFKNRILNSSIEKFKKEVTLTSNIPQGYGIGSSGAIVAFFYDYFIVNKVSNLKALKKELALLEDFFHSKSSGIDPLTSFLNESVVIQSDSISNFEIHQNFLSKFELIDSKKNRVAKDAILKYNQWLNKDISYQRIEKALKLSNEIVDEVIKNKYPISLIERLSKWQFENWQFLIPETIKNEWEEGLMNRSFFYKLCGAGDGGFFLKFFN